MRRWLTDKKKIFSIGGCFSINFSKWLRAHGVNVDAPVWGYHYSPLIISDEICASASGLSRVLPFWKLPDGKCVSKTRHPFISENEADFHCQMGLVSGYIRSAIAKSDAFLITYALSDVTEEFCDPDGWISLNRLPPNGAICGNLRSRLLSPQEVSVFFKRTVDSIRSVSPNAIIVVSVSPVPLKKSYSKLSLLEANEISKRNLIDGITRCVSEIGDPNVEYFDAYDVFFSLPKSIELWQADGRHPSAAAVSNVCRAFVDRYAVEVDDFKGVKSEII